MFAVLWARSTLDDLAHIRGEIDESQRQIVSAAIREIGLRLRDDPEKEGESRPNGQRISFVAPLAFTFKPVADERIVVVSNVWWFGKR
ncbi:MAG: hypothetical protein HUU20_21415 [Pirellulales bacterium]|nr:hypothetical protein [Pirellulales bacterium]